MPDPHPKDVGRKPGRILFSDGASEHYDHVDTHDGYVLAMGPSSHETDSVLKYPWRLIKEVRLFP